MSRRAGWGAALAVTATVLGGVPGAAAAPQPATVGAPGAGDPFFPRAGNGGYDVTDYRLELHYVPRTHRLGGWARVTARATVALSRFDLDLRRTMVVRSVSVAGRAARFSRPAAAVQELVVTPARPLRRGQLFTVIVRYTGTASPVIDPDGSLDGFVPTGDGAFVAAEPQGAPSWFPCNDVPTDKARFDIAVTVPSGVTAVSNGTLVARTAVPGGTRWRWRETQPMSTYLATLTMGRFVTWRGRTRTGIPVWNAVDPTQLAKARRVLAHLPAIVDYYSALLGRYPFSSVGAIVDDAAEVGYSLETQTRPVFDRAPDEATLAHELAHQWYGDAVTLRQWPDIWLHEGFAEFLSWAWVERSGGMTAHAQFARFYAKPAGSDVWDPPPHALVQAKQVFSSSVYERGAMTLQALREKLGDRVFFRVLRGFLAQHRYGNASVAQFRAYAQTVAGIDLRRFFWVWLEQPGKPTSW